MICTRPLSKDGLHTGTISSPNRYSVIAPGQIGSPKWIAASNGVSVNMNGSARVVRSRVIEGFSS